MQARSREPEIVSGTAADVPALTEIFFRAVRIGAAAAYSPEQREAWAPAVPSTEVWRDRLAQQAVFIARESGACLGFMTLMPDGLIDLAFVDPDHAGQGVAYRLYQALETDARQAGLDRLHTKASELARPFFMRQGWSVDARQELTIRGTALHNYLMHKVLD